MTLSPGLITLAAWITFASIGAFVTAFNLNDARMDLRSIREAKLANGRGLVAKVALWNEATRLLIHILLLIAGIMVAWKQWNPDPPPASLYVRSVILLTIVLLVYQTIALRWLRHKIR